jgi:predicted amidohydrolase
MMPVQDLPRELKAAVTLEPTGGQWVERGGSCIIGPNSRFIVEPVFDREELIFADLDLTQIDRETMTFDVSGHYARPDLFRFEKKDVNIKGQS